MKFVADLHLHSKYSRAVSPQMLLPNMAQWGVMKGINVLASSDFTHPFWFDHLKNELIDNGNGLFRLNNNDKVQFILSCEISSIYSQNRKSHRIHNLVFFPKLKSVEKFNEALVKRGGNLRSDGRPIVGISSRDLAHVANEADNKAMVIPAHIWTPWFSLFGSMSGFDSIEECFGDMADKIYAVETGLSSDPAMNWRVSELDSRAIISCSDAHSLEKIGREATMFEADSISYNSIYNAIKGDSKAKIAFTIEFYPEEGKYHYTGHRDCGISQSPEQTKRDGDNCPKCGRKLTVGVMHRVEDLANRESETEYLDRNGVRWTKSKKNRPPFVSLVPLAEIIAEVEKSTIKTKKVFDQYNQLVNFLGSEFNVLLKADLGEINQYSTEKITEGIKKVRSGNINIEPGFDNTFGIVKIWSDETNSNKADKELQSESQLNLFVS